MMTIIHRNFLFVFLLTVVLGFGCSSKSSSTQGPDSVATVTPPTTTNNFYIDPTASAGGDGSEASPYNDLSFLTQDGNMRLLASDTSYFFKRGTEFQMDDGSLIGIRTGAIKLEKIVVGAYGEGERPKLVYVGDGDPAIINIGNPSGDFDGIYIVDIEIDTTYEAYDGSAIAVQTTNGLGENLIIQNCKLRGGYNAFRHMGGQDPDVGLRILNSELYGSNDDGIITSNVDDVEVGGCYIHSVNQKWHRFLEEYPNGITCEDDSSFHFDYCPGDASKIDDISEACEAQFPYDCGGDAIQLIAGANQWIHRNLIDRTDSGNKFSIIVSNTLARPSIEGCVVEHNVVKGPLAVNTGGTAIYVAGRGDADIRYNMILPPHSSSILAQHSDEVNVVGNVISGGTGGVSLGMRPDDVVTSRTVFNNVFYNIDGLFLAPVGEPTEVRNNIFFNQPGDSVVSGVGVVTGSHNLFLTDENTFGTDNVIGDPLFANAGEYDFTLQSGSPAIDKGTMTGLGDSPVDMEGTSIPQGSAPDIGAFEQ